eukprot:TRINITY_DN3378_c0_g1_i1.p1 TRINITY_DN3378_c0_g1~~TRINITY_DN3378_c0_g1_i1.p1  ORF type:complete len:144 (+),score=45.36 TRINITY_DN3378_c0_g1_i1:40-471(+)
MTTEHGALNREQLRNLIRVAESAERYDDMCKFIKKLVEDVSAVDDLTVEERNLLSVAYKNVVGSRRASWRYLNVEEHKNQELIKVYKGIIENELETICRDALELLAKHLVPGARSRGNVESQVFYLKMYGDERLISLLNVLSS